MKNIIIFHVSFCFSLVRSLTNVEIEFVVQFTSFLSRSNCILVDDPNGLKNFTGNFISSTYLTRRNIPEFLLHQESHTTEKIVLVLKGHDFYAYENIFNELPISGFLSQFTWIIILNRTLDLSTIQDQVIIPFDSELFLVEQSGRNAYYIQEIYREQNTPTIYLNHIGNWSLKNGLSASRLSFSSRRSNMKGYPMTVLIPEKKCHSAMECSLREIWFDLATHLNITTILLTFEEHEKKIWETNREVLWDVSLQPITYNAYTFTTKAIAPIWKLTVFMHVRHDSDEEFSWPIYFSNSWGSIVYIIMWITSLILWLTIFDYLQSLYLHKRKFYPSNGIFTVFFWIFNQGGIYAESSFSLLILIGLLRIILISIHNFGIGNIVAYLSVTVPHYPFHGLQDILKNDNKYSLIILNGSISQLYLQFIPMATENKLVKKFLPEEEMPSTLIEAMNMMCNDGKIVALADNNDLMDLDEKNCKILQIPFPVVSIFCGIPLYDESSLEFIFISALVRIMESGVMNKIRRKYYKGLKKEKETYLHSITLNQVKAFFVVLECGIALSFIVLIIEYLCHSRGKKKKNRRNALLKVIKPPGLIPNLL